jgi:hypothetical protein
VRGHAGTLPRAEFPEIHILRFCRANEIVAPANKQ